MIKPAQPFHLPRQIPAILLCSQAIRPLKTLELISALMQTCLLIMMRVIIFELELGILVQLSTAQRETVVRKYLHRRHQFFRLNRFKNCVEFGNLLHRLYSTYLLIFWLICLKLI